MTDDPSTEICRIRQVTDKKPLRMDIYFVAERIGEFRR